MAGGGGPVAFQPGGHHPRRKEATFNKLSATIVTLVPNAQPVYYLDIYNNFITGPWVRGQVNIWTQLTADASAGTNTLSVASGVNYPTGSVLSVESGTSKQKQYKVTAGGGTNTLTVTPSIATALASGTTVHPLWGDSAHLKDWDALAYFTTNAKRADGTPVIQAPGAGSVVLLGNPWFVAGGAAIAASIQAKYPGATVLNKGINGQTSNQILARFDADVPGNASYVIINELGVNDTKAGALTYRDQSIRNLAALVEKCRNIGAIPVFIGVPRLTDLPNASKEMSIWMKAALESPTFPDLPATAIAKVLAPSATLNR